MKNPELGNEFPRPSSAIYFRRALTADGRPRVDVVGGAEDPPADPVVGRRHGADGDGLGQVGRW